MSRSLQKCAMWVLCVSHGGCVEEVALLQKQKQVLCLAGLPVVQSSRVSSGLAFGALASFIPSAGHYAPASLQTL